MRLTLQEGWSGGMVQGHAMTLMVASVHVEALLPNGTEVRLPLKSGKPLLQCFLCLGHMFGLDMASGRCQRCAQHADVVGVAHDWRDVGNDVDRRDKIAECTIDGGFCPGRGI